MLSRRVILTLLLLLPIAAQASSNTSASKRRHRHHARAEAASDDAGAHPTASGKASASKTAEPARHATAAKADGPTVITKGSTAASKLATHAVDAIPASEASLYDRRTAHASAPSESGIFSKWFGPKADGVRYDSRMLQAAQIAEARARHHSARECWRYVKEALLAANVVDTYPQTALAKQAGDELINRHGFRKLSISDPFKAPVGSVLVYGGPGAGHVEIRTADGFVSDFESPTPSKRPLLGVFVKPS